MTVARRSASRTRYVALAFATIIVGLIVHLGATALPSVARDVLGDALWAMMMVWLISAVVPTASVVVRSAAALAVCFAVECSQLIHTSALDVLRNTTIGGLALGSGFDPRDFVAYSGGVLLAVLIDRVFV